MPPTTGRGDGWDAVGRIEDKLADFMDEARTVLREQQTFMAELATRQAVVEERLRRAESDLAVTSAEASKAHRRIDEWARSNASQVGMRRGMVAGITLASTVGGSSLALAAAKILGG